jgi:putative FmdB family regulatory protein
MPIYEFACAEGHVSDLIRHYDRRNDPVACLTCGAATTRREVSASHVPPDGMYSYAPNLGSAEQFEQRRVAQREGKRVIPKVG